MNRLLGLLTSALLCWQVMLWSRISFDELRLGVLCAAVFAALIWSRRQTLSLQSGPLACTVGLASISFALVRGSGTAGATFATLAPLFWGTGLALLASGFHGLGQYWKAAVALGAVVVTPFVETGMLDLIGIDFAPATAQATAYLLRIAGWEASARDVVVTLPRAWIVVSQGCSGLKTMYFLAGFAVMVLLVFPLRGAFRKTAALLGALLIGFVVNTLRVAMLAVLAGPEGQRVFKFWHVQQGAMLFETLAVVAFLTFYYWLAPERLPPPAAKPSIDE